MAAYGEFLYLLWDPSENSVWVHKKTFIYIMQVSVGNNKE